MLTKALIAASFAFCAASIAHAADPASIGKTAKGRTLTNEKGMTLYTFDKDADGKSACNAQCAANWPPFAASAGAQPSGGYSVVVRDDGSRQWAYHSHPLYTWIKDTKPGDITGDGLLNGAWHVAQP